MISGYLYNNTKPFTVYWLNKIKTTIIPWMFCGTVVWGYEVVRKGLDYAKLHEWLLGNGTYLWFMRLIVLVWLLLYLVKTKYSKIVVFIVVTLLKIILLDMMDYSISINVIKQLVVNLPYFTVGIILKETSFLSVCLSKCKLIKKHITLPVDSNIYEYISKKLLFLGKYSFIIYLIHMPVAGLVSNIFSRSNILLYFVLLQPIIVLIIVEQMVNIIKKICKLMPRFSIFVGMYE